MPDLGGMTCTRELPGPINEVTSRSTGGAIGVVGLDFERGKSGIAVVELENFAFAGVEIVIVDYGVGGFGDDAAVLALETKVDGLEFFMPTLR